MTVTQTAIVTVVVVGGYLLPTVVAGFRAHHNSGAICALNLFLGWTVLGWLAALVWAFTSPSPSRSDQPYAADTDERAIRRAIRRGSR